MSWYVVDVEANGPCPNPYSMVQFGVVLLDRELKTTCHGYLSPMFDPVDRSENGMFPEMNEVENSRLALASCNLTWEEVCGYPPAELAMNKLWDFIEKTNKHGRPMFIGDNIAFDWQYINWYFHRFLGKNPFGFSATRINDLYKGWNNDMRANFKPLRKTKHDHNPVNDALGNAEAILTMIDKGFNFRI